MERRRRLPGHSFWRFALLGLCAGLIACGCIAGVAPLDAAIGKWQFVKTYITDDTRPLIGSIYDAQASCRAYLEASKAGARRAENLNMILLLVSGIAALVSSALCAFSGIKSATTENQLAETPEAGHAPEALAHFAGDVRIAKITAIVSAATTLVIGVTTLISNVTGPSKSREEFLAAIGEFQNHLQKADAEVDRFNNLMSKNDAPEAGDALRTALSELQKCDVDSGKLDWDDASIRNYKKHAEAEYALILEATQKAREFEKVALEARRIAEKPEYGPYDRESGLARIGLSGRGQGGAAATSGSASEMKAHSSTVMTKPAMTDLTGFSGLTGQASALPPLTAAPGASPAAATRVVDAKTAAAVLVAGLPPDQAKQRSDVLIQASKLFDEGKVAEGTRELTSHGISLEVRDGGLAVSR